MSAARERLATVLSPAMLSMIDAYVDERVEARVSGLAAERLNGRQRSEYLTVDEAADLLRADRQRIYDLCSSGRLTRHKDGSRVLIRRAELEAYLAAGRNGVVE